ncbi:MAG: (d)CMP kinase [Proteobacteria bacterium]|nr:(d)CMP kinase [Pseudomonadota bacterium]MBU1389173.1 (d)CMP kinase [Pseudomonadota bacterium]MBU1543397.1 (d)CMP kinase [Pseudomonadota bacterium]MBU2430203.1 (d)CMP kinase [Pseudomonadota bacterium]MBU2482908.1 (d)CMP kinase [Pseudomonadota bacterium]
MDRQIVTIDGPAGAGKSTVAKRLAQELGCIYVDTGALYRGVAYEILQHSIDWENEHDLKVFLSQLDLNFVMENQQLILTSHGKDISGKIRTPQVTMLASSSSAKPAVRKALLSIQKNIAENNDAVFEGRDMGTVVFPKAPFKFFLFADLNIRAKRRYDEMCGDKKDIHQVKEQMAQRDENDSQRQSAPLKPADDAVKIDSSSLTINQVVDMMIKIIRAA